jgi:MoaA/NifB/PqqE/SkfB family radical SAM enzyme
MHEKLRFLIDHGLLGDDSDAGPYSVEIDPTNSCTADCGFCIWSRMRGSESASLSPSTISDLIADLIELGVQGIVFTGGGEPLAHPYTTEAIRQASVGGARVGLLTNGTLMSADVSAQVLPHLSWVRVNLSAPNRTAYLHTHGTDSFSRVIDNINQSILLRDSHGLGTRLGIGCVLRQGQSAGQDIPLMIDLANHLNVDYVQFKHDLNGIGTVESDAWWRSEVVPALEDCTKRAPAKVRVEFSARTYPPRSAKPCLVTRRTAAVRADGSVSLCKLHRDTSSMQVGNVNATAFRDLWAGERRRELLALLEREGCALCCPYDAANDHVCSVEQASRAYADSWSTERALRVGMRRFGEDICFI